MIHSEQKKLFLSVARDIRAKGLDVDYRIEFDEITLTAYLVYYIKGQITDAPDIVRNIERSLEDYFERSVSIYTTRSKGRGRPKKNGAPATEGLTLRCVLPSIDE